MNYQEVLKNLFAGVAALVIAGVVFVTIGAGNGAPPLGCAKVGFYDYQCEQATDWQAVPASTSTSLWSTDLAPDDDQSFTVLFRVRVHGGSSAASNRAWWVRSFRGSEISGVFTDPTGATTDQANASQVGSALSSCTPTLVQSGTTLTASISCPVIVDAYVSVSSSRGAAPIEVTSVSPTSMATITTLPSQVTLTVSQGGGWLPGSPTIGPYALTQCTSTTGGTTILCVLPAGTYAGTGLTVSAGPSDVLPLPGGFSFTLSDGGVVDSGIDSGTDAGVDSGTDAGTDAGTDSGTDAGSAGTISKMSARESILTGGQSFTFTSAANLASASLVTFSYGGSSVTATPSGTTATTVTFTAPNATSLNSGNGAHTDVSITTPGGAVTSTAASGGGFEFLNSAAALLGDCYTVASTGLANGGTVTSWGEPSGTGSTIAITGSPIFASSVSGLGGQCTIATGATAADHVLATLGTAVNSTGGVEAFVLGQIPASSGTASFENMFSVGIGTQSGDSTAAAGLFGYQCGSSTTCGVFATNTQYGFRNVTTLGSTSDVFAVFSARFDPGAQLGYARFNSNDQTTAWLADAGTAYTFAFDRFGPGFAFNSSGVFGTKQVPAINVTMFGAFKRVMTTAERAQISQWIANLVNAGNLGDGGIGSAVAY